MVTTAHVFTVRVVGHLQHAARTKIKVVRFCSVPTAPPYFLALFLISAIFHARPWCGAVLVLYGAK